MFINLENQQKEQYYVMFINQSPTIDQKCQASISSLNPTNVLIATGEIIKTGTLFKTLHKPVGEVNPYV